jgi:glycosyltransferase involved in cell wall biosynthesis
LKVTIVTVCYNSENTIEKTIKSVLEQTYHDIEYIVIDGNSSDKTVEVISQYASRISVFKSEPDKGIYDAMNKGIGFASGDIIGVLNSDDFYISNNIISEIVDRFLDKPESQLLIGNVDFVSADKAEVPVRRYSSVAFKPWQLMFGFMPAHPATFITKPLYKLVGKYKDDYKIGADFDLFVRIFLTHNIPFDVFDKTVVRMTIGGVSTSGWKSYHISTNEMLRSFKENKKYTNVLFVLVRLPIKFIQQAYYRCTNKLFT